MFSEADQSFLSSLMPKSITSREDIVFLLTDFYKKAQADPLIGSKFEHLNMSEHIQTIADFWDSILFGANTYQGDPFGKHIPLQLKPQDFDRWLELFTGTIDEHYKGAVAEEAKHRASTIARVFQSKLAR
jgi:hemoglobin